MATIVACSTSEETSNDEAAVITRVAAKIEVSTNDATSSRTAEKELSFSSLNNTVSDIHLITVSVKEGVQSHIDNQTLTKDTPDGKWKATLLNLPIGSTLTFSGNAYDNVSTLTFQGSLSTSLSATGTNIIPLVMYPISNNTTQTFPTITSVLRPSEMNVGTTASIQVAVKASDNEKLNYYFISGGGSFNPGAVITKPCPITPMYDHCIYEGVDFPLTGSTGTIISTYTAPTVIPLSGAVAHRVLVRNSQNNAVEVSFSIKLTNGVSGAGTYSLEPIFAPVITGITGTRGYPGSIDNGSSSSPDYLVWRAEVNRGGYINYNSYGYGYSYSQTYKWDFPGVNFCRYYGGNSNYCNSGDNSNSVIMTPYNPDNTTGILTFEVSDVITRFGPSNQRITDNISTKVYYNIPLGLFPDNVVQ